ncbi:hypothetical protein TBLA_0A08590 [Henningerozyma blattae CBS 6284]|uniref:LSM complex subunit LSM5 n=1 Tax=Henningerozyma blattae (strain ATCC 34711 / CBS 6284 / DSM 70876 / NBRC 10599 / NRRL Y-10934 / UCD 77-7) TaxID=1071380 RepID=I2GWZ7_HENB6|nr:hypothetical protein TBLA_0A08590 [Tetrapisispora blattae CBS 6284]CCH58649.1 hypothetical protein TBLA_0A08590 [Tetrapisispora blattae CBS 6284]
MDSRIDTLSVSSNTTASLPDILPLEIIDKAINQQVWILLQSQREFIGKLIGVDDFVNVIIEDVTEYIEDGESRVMEHHGRMLLSGNSIAIIIPGGRP